MDELIREIDPADQMAGRSEERYFAAGKSALDCVDLALKAAKRAPGRVTSILDYGSGHGRVLRHLKAAFPHARLSVADVDRRGVEFCVSRLGANELVKDDLFDLIWVGSVFTHLPPAAFVATFDLLVGHLDKRGLLVFTTAGRTVAELARRGERGNLSSEGLQAALNWYDATGFGYARYPKAAPTEDYGRAFVKPSFVLKYLESQGLFLTMLAERAWDNRQDVYVVTR